MSKCNDMLEYAIIGKLVSTLINEGYRIEVSDQDGDGLFVYAVPDGGETLKYGYKYWVRLVPGNGCDIIVDYTTNLEKDLKSVNEFAEQYRD